MSETIAVLFAERHTPASVRAYLYDLGFGDLIIEATTRAPIGVRISAPPAMRSSVITEAQRAIRDLDEPDRSGALRIPSRASAMHRSEHARVAREVVEALHRASIPETGDGAAHACRECGATLIESACAECGGSEVRGGSAV